jgi:hypothetical protein
MSYPDGVPADALDLGDGHWLVFTAWSPDRELNPQYDGIASVDRYGAIIYHTSDKTETGLCVGGIVFDSPTARAIEREGRPMWAVQSWEPLTISPSLLCWQPCGDHGFIREGKWVRA